MATTNQEEIMWQRGKEQRYEIEQEIRDTYIKNNLQW